MVTAAAGSEYTQKVAELGSEPRTQLVPRSLPPAGELRKVLRNIPPVDHFLGVQVRQGMC